MGVKSTQLFDSIKHTFDDILQMLNRKNSDYAGDEDAYKNFMDPELTAILQEQWPQMDAVELGIRIRLKDKWSRINTLFLGQKEAKVKDESIEDTLRDTIGYIAIWLAYREWRRAGIKPDTLKDLGHWSDLCFCGEERIDHNIDYIADGSSQACCTFILDDEGTRRNQEL